jgi:soluble lytic murein transglycosylase-like protein
VRIRLHLTIAGALLAGTAVGAKAAERATLTNGFTMTCDHHALVDGKLRLYLSADGSSYIERQPEEVTGFDTVPDAPAEAGAEVNPLAGNAKLSPVDLHEMLDKAGHEHNLDVDLLASLVKAESGGNARAVSRTGAKGLMQLMPATANDLGVQDSFKPSENVSGGTTYLDTLLTRYHENLALALAAYNAGPAAVDKYRGIPPYHETRAYVARVIHEFNRRVLAREAEARRAAAVPVTSRTSSAQ